MVAIPKESPKNENLIRIYCEPALSQGHWNRLQLILDKKSQLKLTKATHCFYVQLREGTDLNEFRSKYLEKVLWLLSRPEGFGERKISFEYDYTPKEMGEIVFEIGPRLNMTSAFSTNAVSACTASGIENVYRIERSTIYRICVPETHSGKVELCRENAIACLHDRMTECEYVTAPESLKIDLHPEKFERVAVIDLLGENGVKLLELMDKKLGLSFDEWDRQYYLKLYREKVQRNPTDVELFDLAQSNSEHSRHWFFKGKIFVDGQPLSESLFDMIMGTQNAQSNDNNVIKFCDNSSAIRGFQVSTLANASGNLPEKLNCLTTKRHIIYTAETHNFPTGVCPFPGAATGTGGRIRDVHATGRGAHEIAGFCGYAVGNLHLDGYELPWERRSDGNLCFADNFARPKEILIEASNGASDYGNKFGEPVLSGFARTFGMSINFVENDGDCPKKELLSERVEYIKPIMFSGGVGSIDDALVHKEKPESGMLLTKLGGPAYRIGVGGGAASSLAVQALGFAIQGTQCSNLDFNAVQRGDPEMAQKLHRVIRACVERCFGGKCEVGIDSGDFAPMLCPIAAIHDQGAGGNGNVLKELVEGSGAIIDAKNFTLADDTLSIKELWAAEYQESDALLVRPEMRRCLEEICARERCPVDFVGVVNGPEMENSVILRDFSDNERTSNLKQHPVELNLDWALGKMPPKEFHLKRSNSAYRPLQLPTNLKFIEALNLVLRLPSVASKRYLTNKVDRSVTGLVAQQQCVGPLHTPVADCAVVALSHFDTFSNDDVMMECFLPKNA